MLSGDTNTKQKTHYGLCESPPEAFALLLQHLSFQVVVYPGPVCSREGAAVTSASCPRQDVTAAGLLQFVQVSTASGTERRVFFVSLTSTIQTMQRVSLDLFPMSQRFLSSPFPCHEPRTSPANPGHVHPECHSPDPCALFPFPSRFTRTSLPSVLLQKQGLEQENVELHSHSCKFPPEKPLHHCLECKAIFTGLGFCPK